MTLAFLYVSTVCTAALFLALGRWIGRRERPTAAHRPASDAPGAHVIRFPDPAERVRFSSRRGAP